MKLAKRIWYKLIIVMCVVTTFCTFIASTPVEASKVNTSDFYYSGTTKGSYTQNKSFLENLIESLGSIVDYILGLSTMGLRMVFVGWTALMERSLTWIFEGASGEDVAIDEVSSTNLIGSDEWITVDAIFFNHVPLLDINFFNFEVNTEYNAIGGEKEETTNSTSNESLVLKFKKIVAGWYYSLRLISIMVMLVLLMYIGIKIAITSSVTDKATYKKMLVDWVVGMILVFGIHYIMLFVITINETLVNAIAEMRSGATSLQVYEYGLKERAQTVSNEDLEYTLYDEVKTRAYDVKMTVGTTGLIMYMMLVFYAWKFSFIYLKRYLTVAVLIIMAPLIAVSYAYNKVRTGKSIIFSKWLKEFVFIILLQSIHALMYVVFVQTALAMSLNSISGIILVFVLLNFMSSAEGLFRKIFNIQGNLTNDIAAGSGIRDLANSFKNAMATMAVGKVAKNYTKGVAKIVTKPLAATGNVALKAGMKRRAKRLDAKAAAYAQKYGDKRIKDYSDMKMALRRKRNIAFKLGGVLKQLENGEIDIDELEESVNALEEGQVIKDEYGLTKVVDADYIKDKKRELQEIKDLNALRTSTNPALRQSYDSIMDNYNKIFNKKGEFKRFKVYATEKWEDILDPTKYTRRVKDKNGNTVYKTIDSQKDNSDFQYGVIHFKHFTKGVGKRTNGVSEKLLKQLKLSNLAGLKEDEKKAINAQIDFIKNELYGFMGIGLGLPMAVADSKIGVGLLAVGISNSSKVLSSTGRKKERSLKAYKLDVSGKYSFKSFEGKSKHTIAEGAKVMARGQVREIVNAKAKQEASMKARMETKHPKLASLLKVQSSNATAFKMVAMGTAGTLAGISTPVVIGTTAAYGATKLTGKIVTNSRIGDNAWSKYQDSIRAATKADGKLQEKTEKSLGANDYMNLLADSYYELEHQEAKSDAERHAERLGQEYAVVLATMQNKIDEKTNEEILRDTAYEEEIKLETTSNGKAQLSLSSENKLIDDALIEYAQKSGIMDISQLNVENGQDQIEKILRSDLISRGILERDGNVESVVQDIKGRIKDRQAIIAKEGKGQEVIEDKIAGDAIVSIMQEKGITDPSQVSDKEAEERFTLNYQETLDKVTQSSKQTDSVLEGLNAQKGDNSATPKATIDKDKIQAKAKSAVQARKSIFADRAKQRIDDSAAKSMKETLKRKNEIELDKKLLAKEEELSQGISGMLINESGGIDSSKDGSISVGNSDNIIKMLQIQTQLYQDKKKMAYTEQKRNGSRNEKVKEYQAILRDGATMQIDSMKDGSIKVANPNIELSEIIKRKKQELKV